MSDHLYKRTDTPITLFPEMCRGGMVQVRMPVAKENTHG